MSELLHFFHGTTLEAADQIRVGGWQARDLPGMVGELATKHEVPVPDVIDDLRRYNRFMLMEKDRGQVASLAPDYESAAGSWAQRAPEVEWDALWAIWRIKHSGETEMYHWNRDVPGHAWVLEQMAHSCRRRADRFLGLRWDRTAFRGVRVRAHGRSSNLGVECGGRTHLAHRPLHSTGIARRGAVRDRSQQRRRGRR